MHQILAIILTALYLFLNTNPINAQTMSNSSYIIKMGNINTAAGEVSGSSYKLSTTVGQTAPGLYSGTNYKVKAGFQYIPRVRPFVFTVSQTLIDFGTLYPTNPVIRTATLTVSKTAVTGYSVITSEDHPLKATTSTITDTTCDNGSCSESVSSLWTNTLTYGFGYRCDNLIGTDCSADFSKKDFYKQFSDDSKTETNQVVMAGTSGREKKAQISYKVNISATQAPGSYGNTITYIASPTF